MPGKIVSKAQFGMLQAAAHGNGRTGDPSPATAKKILADNPVDVKALPRRVPKAGSFRRSFGHMGPKH